VAVALVVVLHACKLLEEVTADERLRALLDTGRPVWALGRTGVHLFFVLSGYLLFQPYGRAAEGASAPSLGRYFIRRLRRILPAYYACLALLVLLGWARWQVAVDDKHVDVLLHLALVHNWSSATLESINPPFWTLAVEAQFYLLLPLLGAAYLRAARRFGLTVPRLALAVLAPASTIANAALQRSFSDSGWWNVRSSAALVLAYFPPFAVGMWIATQRLRPRRRAVRVGTATLAAGIVLVHAVPLASGRALGAGDLFPFNLVMGGAYGLALWSALTGRPDESFPVFTPLRALGLVSYSVYLWHYPVLTELLHASDTAGRVAIALAGFGLILASFLVLERWIGAVGAGGRSRSDQRVPL
jgi:peptidoglycan/LPS O-acetylase OafA/YrhL